MKTFPVLGIFALILASCCAFAQSTLNTISGRVYVGDERAASALGLSSWGPTDYVPAGNTTLRVGLYYSLTENGPYTQAGSAATFSAVSAGRFSSGHVAIPGLPEGSSAWLQVRVWENSYGANYETATTAPMAGGRLTIRGESARMNIITGSTQNLEFEPFGVYVPVPEPATFSLGLLGLTGWLIARRRSVNIER